MLNLLVFHAMFVVLQLSSFTYFCILSHIFPCLAKKKRKKNKKNQTFFCNIIMKHCKKVNNQYGDRTNIVNSGIVKEIIQWEPHFLGDLWQSTMNNNTVTTQYTELDDNLRYTRRSPDIGANFQGFWTPIVTYSVGV